MVLGISGFHRKHDIPEEHNGGMSSHHIIASPLELLGKRQIRLAHFKKHFNIPAFSIDSQNLLIGNHGIG
jgi:hypothetical protein